ncbi:MAG: phosphoenolpyruvate synthase, partial [Desulfobulbaceae bacterium]|nr:phosphoenolpyruvate synthase [Desulfobulbaceae bacterium]
MNSTFNSDALKANLEETAVDEVIIDSSMQLLLEEAGKYKGIHNSLYELLHEIYHPYRNWSLILPRFRTFVLKNAPLYCRSPRKTDTFSRFTDLFFLALRDTKKNETLLALGMESLLAYVEKIIAVAGAELLEYDHVLGQLFNRLYDLDNEIIMF